MWSIFSSPMLLSAMTWVSSSAVSRIVTGGPQKTSFPVSEICRGPKWISWRKAVRSPSKQLSEIRPSMVTERERIFGRMGAAEPVEMLAIYEVRGEHIVRVHFVR